MLDRNLNGLKGMIERVAFFDNAQGGKSSAIVSGGSYIWESGSNREMNAGNGVGLLMDSDWYDKNNESQMRELLWYRIKYYRQKLEDSINIFEQAKDELKRRAGNAELYGSVPPDKSEVKQVRRLRHSVKGYENKLNELMEILNPPTQPIVLTEEQQKLKQQNQNAGNEILNSLKTLEV